MKLELPKSWLVVRLGGLAQPTRPRQSPRDYPELPFIGMEHIEAQTMKLLGTVSAGSMLSSAVHFQPGDVLYGRLRPYLNKVFRPDFEGLCSAEFIVFPQTDGVDSKYLQYLLNSARFVSFASHLNAGDRPRVDFAQISEFPFPLAPLAEQKRIVEEIEKQFTRLDAAVAALKRVQANLKRYRAAVLKTACEGRLVPTEAELARRENRSYEPASALLERILTERRIGWEAKFQAGVNKRKYDDPEPPDSTGLGPLPEGWVWTNLRQLKLFSIYGPRFSSDDYTTEGTVVLRTTDISEWGKVDLESAPKLQLSDADFEKYKLLAGDLVFTRTGATIGKTAIFNDAVRAIPGAYLIHFRLATPATTAWYVYRFFQSVVGQSYLLAGRLGIGQPNLNAPTIEAIPIPLPPSAEQDRILEAINAKLAVVEKEMGQVADSCRRADRLRQSILKRAFEGNLIPQDPRDESASVLIARIRAEREVESRSSRKGAKEIVAR